MVIFFSDLDNTLIFSHRRKYEGAKVVAEFLNGKEQSYISLELLSVLKDNTRIKLVPVTTRSIDQYTRIHILSNELHTNHALVCNGGVLLVDGKLDEDWLNESLILSEQESFEVNKILIMLKSDAKVSTINRLQPFMFYFTCEAVDEYYSYLIQHADLNKVFIGKDARKIYVIASCINKGSSVERYVHRFGSEKYIIAGDSDFDIPMLNLEADGIASIGLKESISNKRILFSREGSLYAEIAQLLENYVK